MISREFIEQNGYNVKTITEDIELTVQCAINKERIAFAEEAITYDEQPLRFGESYKQRKRWSKGMLDCLKIYKKDLKSGIFRRFELLDASITYIILGICEKININYSSKLVFILVSYLMMIMVSSAVTKLANKKVKENLKGIIFLPLFIFSWIPINFEAVMKKQLNWESIEHSRIISIETAMEKREFRTLRKTTNKGLLKIS